MAVAVDEAVVVVVVAVVAFAVAVADNMIKLKGNSIKNISDGFHDYLLFIFLLFPFLGSGPEGDNVL